MRKNSHHEETTENSMDENKCDNNEESGDKEESDDNRNKYFHDKKSENLARLNLHSKTEIDTSTGSDTKTTKENKIRDEEMVTFDNRYVKQLQKIYFQSKVINFVLDYIPIFEKIMR